MSWHWYFAYGSNMQSATFRGRRGIVPRRAVPARAPGWRLVLDKPPLLSMGHSFANVVPDPAASVYGVAYEIGADDLAHVEFSEGVPFGNYVRVELDLETLSGEVLHGCTLASDKRATGLQPSLRYMALLVEGAIEHGLPDDWIAMLRAVPAIEESEEAKAARALLDRVIRKPRP
ncbi:MAG TPA: gamma-glutamylcyclotransferase family protein [Candidatus Limnocylindria bacterium]|nr:gamma-glutamylcyclotransferase family protein [Candidatus Limnocylindria bacterium]